jgi:hypothetical protein
MTNNGFFQCGKCGLIETGITQSEVLELSAYHFSGKHIDIDELRRLKKVKGQSHDNSGGQTD